MTKFLYAVVNTEDGKIICVTDAEHFNKYGFGNDITTDSMQESLDALLGTNLGMDMENMYLYDALIEASFERDSDWSTHPKFTKLCETSEF